MVLLVSFVNQSAPSGPEVIAAGPAIAVEEPPSVDTVPAALLRPRGSPEDVENHRAPSGPVVNVVSER